MAWLPIASSIIACLLSAAPLPFTYQFPMPLWLLLNIGYWTIIQQKHLPMLSLFLLGLIQDITLHSLLGTHAFLLLGLSLLLQSPSALMQHKKTLLEAYPIVTLIVSAYMIALMLLTFLSKDHLMSLHDVALLWCSTIIGYPLLHLGYQRLLPTQNHF